MQGKSRVKEYYLSEKSLKLEFMFINAVRIVILLYYSDNLKSKVPACFLRRSQKFVVLSLYFALMLLTIISKQKLGDLVILLFCLF